MGRSRAWSEDGNIHRISGLLFPLILVAVRQGRRPWELREEYTSDGSQSLSRFLYSVYPSTAYLLVNSYDRVFHTSDSGIASHKH
jgi:hypothetical protein